MGSALRSMKHTESERWLWCCLCPADKGGDGECPEPAKGPTAHCATALASQLLAQSTAVCHTCRRRYYGLYPSLLGSGGDGDDEGGVSQRTAAHENAEGQGRPSGWLQPQRRCPPRLETLGERSGVPRSSRRWTRRPAGTTGRRGTDTASTSIRPGRGAVGSERAHSAAAAGAPGQPGSCYATLPYTRTSLGSDDSGHNSTLFSSPRLLYLEHSSSPPSHQPQLKSATCWRHRGA